jgi:AcrR family transcriptional regulator
LAAALAEFAEQSYSATRLQDVANRVGVSRPYIYRYFKSKEELFEAFLQQWSESHVVAFEDLATAEVASYLLLLKHLLTEIHARLMQEESRQLLKVVLGEGTRFPGASRVYYENVVARCQRAIHQVISRGVTAGEFKPDAALVPTQLYFTASLVSAIWSATFDHIEPLRVDGYWLAHLDLVEKMVVDEHRHASD